MKSTLTSLALLTSTLIASTTAATDCPPTTPWSLSILNGTGLTYFATGTAVHQDSILTNSTQLCLPSGSVTVSIGSKSGSAGALNTLIECNFNAYDGMSFCDISMVQGYSVSVTCAAPDHADWLNYNPVPSDNSKGANKSALGYAEDLYLLNDCAHYDSENMLCVNDNGPSGSSVDSLTDSAFFAPAEKGGSLTYMSSGNSFPFASQGPAEVVCTVSEWGRSKVANGGKKEKRDAGHHRSRHGGRMHARSLLGESGK